MDPFSMVFTLAAVAIGAAITSRPKKEEPPEPTHPKPPEQDPVVTGKLSEHEERMTALNSEVGQLRGIILVLSGVIVLGVSYGTFYFIRQQIVKRRRQNVSRGQNLRCPRIPVGEIEMFEYIGHGAFGNVRRAMYNGQEVAVKRIREVLNRGVESEIAIMVSLQNHPHIVPILGIADEPSELEMVQPPLIIMEYERYGALDQYLADHPAPVTTLIEIARQVADGMHNCHSQPVAIIHRDLGARNVFVHTVEPNIHVKIGDFGLSRLTLAAYTSPSTEIPWRWLGPDSLRGGKYTQHSDVWMFGVLIWEIFQACSERQTVIPWAGEDFTPKFIDRLIAGERLSRPRQCSDALWKLMNDCWNTQPNARPSFETLSERLGTMKS